MTGEIADDSLSFPNDYELKRLQSLMSDWEQPLERPVKAKDAVEYIEYSGEYLLLLDTSMREGRDEAQRVLQWSLNMLAQAKKQGALSDEQENLIQVIKEALEKLSSEE